MSLFTQLPELHRIKCIFRKYGFQPLAHRPCSRGMGQWEQWEFLPKKWMPSSMRDLREDPTLLCLCPRPAWTLLGVSVDISHGVRAKCFHCVSRCASAFPGWESKEKGSTTSTSRLDTQADLSVLPTLAWFQLTLQVTTEVIYRNYIIVLFGDRKFSQAL